MFPTPKKNANSHTKNMLSQEFGQKKKTSSFPLFLKKQKVQQSHLQTKRFQVPPRYKQYSAEKQQVKKFQQVVKLSQTAQKQNKMSIQKIDLKNIKQCEPLITFRVRKPLNTSADKKSQDQGKKYLDKVELNNYISKQKKSKEFIKSPRKAPSFLLSRKQNEQNLRKVSPFKKAQNQTQVSGSNYNLAQSIGQFEPSPRTPIEDLPLQGMGRYIGQSIHIGPSKSYKKPLQIKTQPQQYLFSAYKANQYTFAKKISSPVKNQEQKGMGRKAYSQKVIETQF